MYAVNYTDRLLTLVNASPLYFPIHVLLLSLVHSSTLLCNILQFDSHLHTYIIIHVPCGWTHVYLGSRV